MKRKSLILSFLLWGTLAPLFSQTFSTQDPNYIENVQAGEAALRAGEYETCLEKYATAFEIKRTSYLSTLRAAACAYLVDDQTALKRYLDKAFELSWDGTKNIFDSYEEFQSLQETSFAKQINQYFRKAAEASGIDWKLREEIAEIYRTDQEQRQHMGPIIEKYGWNSPKMDSLWKIQLYSDSVNTARISQIIDKQGYPGKSLVGEAYASTAFLVIQHSNQEVQEKYMDLITAAADEGEVRWASVALLVDRVRLGKGMKQIYGSQVSQDPNTNELFFSPIEHPYKVDSIRATVGLGPLQEYANYYKFKWNPDKHVARHKAAKEEKKK